MVSFFLRFYLGVSVTLIVCLTLLGFLFENQYEGALKQEHMRITRALITIIDTHICESDPSTWPGFIEQVATDYSYHIKVIPKADLDPILAVQMKLNNVFVNVNSGFIQDVIEIYYDSDCKENILKFSPSSEYNSFYNVIIGVTFASILIAVAFAVLLLAWPVIRHINSMLRSMYDIANGDFSTHANESAPAPLDKLACAINFVSKQMDTLLAEQQMLTSAVSHELNTPLMRINYAMEIALKTAQSDLGKEQLKMMREDLHQLEDLVQEILQYSKFRFNKFDIVKRPVKVQDLLKLICTELQPIRSDIILESTAAESLVMNACAKSMHRAISNLVRNAQKYAKQKIQIEAFAENKQIVICVSDDGPGIPDEQKESVLKPFYRIDSSRSKQTGGAGLGLAIVSCIVEAHKATIALLDNESGGLTVKIVLDAEVC